MAYVSGDKIRIFPTANKTAGDTGTNWITEYNLASIVNKLVTPLGASSGFIITEDVPTDPEDSTDNFCFNIGGYYVEVEWKALLSATAPTTNSTFVTFTWDDGCTASITLNNTSSGALKSYNYLAGTDGTVSTESTDNPVITYNLKILNSDNTIYKENTLSYILGDKLSDKLPFIDNGELE